MFTSELPTIVYHHTRGSKRALAWHMPHLLRAVLILSDGTRTAGDLASLLHMPFERVADALRQLIDMALIEAIVLPSMPPAPVVVAPCLYRIPWPMKILKIFGGRHVETHSEPDARSRRVHGAYERSIRAA